MSNREGNPEYPNPERGVRDGFRLQCNHSDCSRSFTGDDLHGILRSAARHWNKEHGSQLSSSHQYTAIDQVEYGGHHIQGNAYEVRKFDVYITSFDVARSLGRIDGFLVEGSAACSECYCYIPNRENRGGNDADEPLNEDWTCTTCLGDQEVEKRAAKNASISEWSTE